MQSDLLRKSFRGSVRRGLRRLGGWKGGIRLRVGARSEGWWEGDTRDFQGCFPRDGRTESGEQ